MARLNLEPTPDLEPGWQILLVQQLAADLGAGKLELPSFPEVVIRIRKLLADEGSSVAEVANVVGSDPALAARLLRLANSSALNTSGKPVNDLRVAITRMGANLVRSCALSFAMKQLQHAESCKPIVGELKTLWERSTLVAAVTRSIAARTHTLNPDEAMLAGLLHAIGKTYILTRAAGHRSIIDNPAALAEIMLTWHTNIGKAILEGWGLPEVICEAVANQDEIDEDRRGGRPSLADVLATGLVVADYLGDPDGLELVIAGSHWFSRIGLDAAVCRAVLQESAGEIEGLKQALEG